MPPPSATASAQKRPGGGLPPMAGSPTTSRVVAWLLHDLHPSLKLYPSSAASFARSLQALLAELGIDKLGLTPASLRAGRATELFMQGEPVDRIRFLGRWKSAQTLEHYIQEAAAFSVVLRLSPSSVVMLENLSSHVHVLSNPPAAPWSVFFSRKRQLASIAVHKSRHEHKSIAAPTRRKGISRRLADRVESKLLL